MGRLEVRNSKMELHVVTSPMEILHHLRWKALAQSKMSASKKSGTNDSKDAETEVPDDFWKTKEFRKSMTDKIRESFTKYKDEKDPNTAHKTEKHFFEMCKTKYQYESVITRFLKYREQTIQTKELRAENLIKIEQALVKYGNAISTASKSAQDIEKKFYSNAESKDEYKALVTSVLENDRKQPKNPEFRRVLLSELEEAKHNWGGVKRQRDSVKDLDEMFFTEAETKEEYFELVVSFIYKMLEEDAGGKLPRGSGSFIAYYRNKLHKFFV